MNTHALEVAASWWALGLLFAEDLIGVAQQALGEGCDSPSLQALAALYTDQVDEARGLFEEALIELGVPQPSTRDAVMRLAREVAKDIMSNAISPETGAKRVASLVRAAPDSVANYVELHTFLYAASEWEDRPEDRHVFEAGVVAAAKMIVAS